MKIEFSEPVLMAVRLVLAVLDQAQLDSRLIESLETIEISQSSAERFAIKGQFRSTSMTGVVELARTDQRQYKGEARLKVGISRYKANFEYNYDGLQVNIFRYEARDQGACAAMRLEPRWVRAIPQEIEELVGQRIQIDLDDGHSYEGRLDHYNPEYLVIDVGYKVLSTTLGEIRELRRKAR